MEDSCAICIESYTKQPHRKRAKCPYCDVQACVSCTQKYLVGSHENPHCMGCRKGWDRDVLDAILLKTWVNGEYRKHREDVLLDRERSRLPAAQIIIERHKEADAFLPSLDELSRQMIELDRQRTEIQVNIYKIQSKMSRIRAGYVGEGTAEKEKEERRAFVLPCPAADCRGFLSTAYKCGVCDQFTCSECREVKGPNKDAEHTCNPDSVKNVAALKKECRNCPDCGASIFRIQGCSQMFCTICKTGFDWNTGKKVTNGAIHNPHYFDYVRTLQKGGIQPRTPGDIPCLGRMPNIYEFDRALRQWPLPADLKTMVDNLYGALRHVNHLTAVVVPNHTNGAAEMDNTELNMQYLKKEITEERWKQALQQREKRRNRRDELRQCYEAFGGACVDVYGQLYNTSLKNDPKQKFEKNAREVEEAVRQGHDNFKQLVDIFNEGVKKIAGRYNCGGYQFLWKPAMNPSTVGYVTREYLKDHWELECISHKELFPTTKRIKKEKKDDDSDGESVGSGEKTASMTSEGGNKVIKVRKTAAKV